MERTPFVHQGWGNYFYSEALANALPKHQNSPQHVPYGLYAEQLSGTAFTVKRSDNRHVWLYRITPSVVRKPFKRLKHKNIVPAPYDAEPCSPNPMRWSPLPAPHKKVDFIDGFHTWVANGHYEAQEGAAVYLYAINQSMINRYFYNSDGELLFVPQSGCITLKTELGHLTIKPGEIAVIPRGIKFQVIIDGEFASGYLCENFGEYFRLPELGIIGANGLANPADFIAPVAAYVDLQETSFLINKFQGTLWETELEYAPLDVVAWKGNYIPFKYDLKHFNAFNTVSFDHPDPSIFTVLTSPSLKSGVANIDFVIFPERWMVAEHTFRPPYYHGNIMSEFMGLIFGQCDAKKEGFIPGGCSLHNSMTPHGPDTDTYLKAIKEELKPIFYKNTLAFMFESSRVWHPTQQALEAKTLQKHYQECWQSLPRKFKT